MRTLNKTLALVLALVMVLGMFGVATAADFTDDETIQYKEAVDVMTGIGSINGMGDGTFAPAGNVTRAQAAKMVAYAVLGADIAETLPVVASSFKDVDANFAWAIPSIEYLVKEGVINGRGDGTFDPNGNVTAYEIAKMLLVAAGYGKNGEFVGPSWALNVAIVAQKNSVFKGTKATDLNAAATREECAFYCFNVLTKVDQVVYSKDTGTYVNANGTAPATTIGTDVYGLEEVEDQIDAFGRPESVWKITGEVDPIATIAATPVAVYNDASYAKDFAAKKYDFVSTGLKILVNGNDYNTQSFTELADRKLNGTGIELYANAKGEINLIVMTQGYLATVSNYTATKGTTAGSFKIEAFNPWAKASATLDEVKDDLKKTDDLFDKLLAAGLEEDDYLIVYTEGADLAGEILKFAPVETVTGALSTFTATDNKDGFNGSVTVGGTKYTLASACVQNDTDALFLSNEDAALSTYLTKNVTVFIDEYGMVIGVVPEVVEETVPDMVYVVNAYTKDTLDAYGQPVPTTYWVQCVDMSGAEVNYQVTEAEVKTIATTTGDPVSAITATAAGLYTVETKTDATLKVTVAEFAEVDVTGLTAKIAAKATTIPSAASTYFDATTVFLFVDGSGATLKVTEATGVQETDGTDRYYYSATKVGTTTNYKVDVVVVNGAPVDADPITAEDLMFVPMAFNKNTAVPYTKADGTPDVAYKNVAFIDGLPKLDVLVTDVAAAGFYTYSVDATTGIYTLTTADKVDATIGGGFVSNVYANYLTTDNTSTTVGVFNNIAGSKGLAELTNNAELKNANASTAKIVDVAYLNDMLTNGSSELTQITTLAGLIKAPEYYKNAVVYYTFTKSTTGVITVDNIYVMAHPSV